jgi:hypothetical protein
VNDVYTEATWNFGSLNLQPGVRAQVMKLKTGFPARSGINGAAKSAPPGRCNVFPSKEADGMA